MKHHHRRMSRLAFSAAVVGSLVLVACGSDDNGSSATTAVTTTTAASGASTTAAATTTAASGGESTTTSGSTPSAGGDDLDAQLAALMKTKSDLPMPSDPVTPGTHEIAIITAGMASTGPATVASNAQDALKVIGWTADQPGDGKFTPTEQAALIEKAVQDKVEGIILVAITPAAVSASIESAQKANIPMVCVLCGPELPAGMVGVEYKPELAGDAQATYVAANLQDQDSATVIVYQNGEFLASTAQAKEAAARMAELCPNCKVETPSLLLAEAREPNAPIFTSLLNDHPSGKLDYVVMPFDTPAGALANTGSQIGRTDFGIVGYGGLSPFIDMVFAGDPPMARADVTISTPFYAWAAVDQLARLLTGADTWETDSMPVGLATKENAGDFEAGLPYLMPDFDYQAEFAKLWGK